MWFGLLGSLVVVGNDGSRLDIGPPQRRQLLSLLLSKPNHPISIDQIGEALWSGMGLPRSAKTSIQAHISRLRRVLGDGRIVTRPPGYLIRADAETFDVLDFTQSVDDGMKLAAARSHDKAFEQLSNALGLWRGQPYSEFLYTDWAQAEMRRLMLIRQMAAEERLQVALDLGRHGAVLEDLAEESQLDPLNERIARLEALALYRSGRQQPALARLERLRSELREELGVDPSPETRDLELAILEHRETLSNPPSRAKVHPPPPIDDGMGMPTSPRGNIIEPISKFVGREFSIAEVLAAARHHRLVTITGPGGAGKTRLALCVAKVHQADFPDGAWLVDLDQAHSSGEVVRTVWEALGLVTTSEPGSINGMLTTALGERAALLVFDNCEHVIDDAARVAERILNACPRVRMIATSREPLAIPGEHLWRIPTLDIPPADVTSVEELLTYESVALFASRATEVDPAFQVNGSNMSDVITICRDLDGLPLAIEMTAAQLQTRSLREVAGNIVDHIDSLRSRFRFAPTRHQTMTSAINWSIDLLTSAQQETLFRLSVFDGTFDRLAAVRMGSGDDDGESLDDLVQRSLVTRVEHPRPRFRILVPIRAHLRKQLDTMQWNDLDLRLARQIADIAGESREAANGRNAMYWYWWCTDGRHVVDQALRWCIEHEPDIGGSIVDGFSWYLRVVGTEVELLRTLRAKISKPRLRASVDVTLAAMLSLYGASEQAVEFSQLAAQAAGDDQHDVQFWAYLVQQTQRLYRQVDERGAATEDIGDRLHESASSALDAALLEDQIGVTHAVEIEDLEGASNHFERAIEVARSHGFQWLLPVFLNDQAECLRRKGQFADATDLLDEAAALCTELDSWHDLVVVLTTLSELQAELGDKDSSLDAAVQAASVAQRHGDEPALPFALELIALNALDVDTRIARAAHECSHAIMADNDAGIELGMTPYHELIESVLGPLIGSCERGVHRGRISEILRYFGVDDHHSSRRRSR